MKLFAIRGPDGKLFGGFKASHRPSNSRMVWTDEQNMEHGEPICLYVGQDRQSFEDVQSMTDGHCRFVEVQIY